MSLHDDIMNIPCKYTRSCFPDAQQLSVYKEGHRDARHAAAELAIAAEQRIEELEEALQELLWAWQHQMSLYEDQPCAIKAMKALEKK